MSVDADDVARLQELIDEINGDGRKLPQWNTLKGILRHLFSGVMDEVVEDNIREDRELLEEIREELSRRNTTRQHHTTGEQEA